MTTALRARVISRHPRRLTGWRASVVWLVVAVDLVAMATAMFGALVLIPDEANLPVWGAAIYFQMVASFGVVGALVSTSQPRNPVGWILGSMATVLALSAFGQYYATFSIAAFEGGLPGTVALAWLSQLLYVPGIAMVMITIPSLFPDGHLLSRRWRWLVWLAIVTMLGSAIPAALQPGPLQNNETLSNPVGVPALASLAVPITTISSAAMAVVAFPMAVVSVVLRYRRGGVIERLQLRWFASAAGMTLAWGVAALIPQTGSISNIVWVLGLLSLSFIPIAIGIAILRYHLYEIDRIISRTIGYAVISITLAVVFAGAILLFQTVLMPLTTGNTAAVAASTLVVAVLFQPLRRRVQRVVDRRFNRSRDDAGRTVAVFTARLRDDVDLESLSADVLAVVARTVSPTSVGIWIRPGQRLVERPATA